MNLLNKVSHLKCSAFVVQIKMTHLIVRVDSRYNFENHVRKLKEVVNILNIVKSMDECLKLLDMVHVVFEVEPIYCLVFKIWLSQSHQASFRVDIFEQLF